MGLVVGVAVGVVLATMLTHLSPPPTLVCEERSCSLKELLARPTACWLRLQERDTRLASQTKVRVKHKSQPLAKESQEIRVSGKSVRSSRPRPRLSHLIMPWSMLLIMPWS